jgi:membrane-associated phospholipid phosphatase
MRETAPSRRSPHPTSPWALLARRQGTAEKDGTAESAGLGTLAPVDRLLLWSLGALAAATAAFQPHPAKFLVAHAALALFLWASARLAPLSRAGDALHAFAPLAVVVGIFEMVGFVVGAANPVRWDAYFAALDDRLFGALVPAWRGALGRPAWLSDVLSAFYVSYYPVPTAMAMALYLKHRRGDFDRFIFGLQVTLLASYVGYFFFPTAGPRVPPHAAQAVLGGGAVSAAVRQFLHSAELNTLDAFPSGHTAVSLVFLAYGWRMLPRWRAPLTVVVAGIVFSTVFLSHHYVIDLVAGALLAAAALAAMPLAHRAFGLAPGPLLPAKRSQSL